MQTHTLEADETFVVYDVHGALPPADRRPLLFVIGQPMEANRFDALVFRRPDGLSH
jgi:hypothetical protein